MKDSGPSAPPWALLSPAAAPPILTFNEPSMDLLHVLSRADSHNSSNLQQQQQPIIQPAVQPRQQQPIDAGEACSPEGQWNCLTTSWQRCASGTWSGVVPCATGTICQPFGLTDHITIEHTSDFNNGEAHQEDNGRASGGKTGDDDRGKSGKSGKSSSGMRTWPGLVLLFGASVASVVWNSMV
ncbi:hypothetical protein BBK36DRAFT_1199370 [Trichoderma citrinoviride]|uniref:Uncharacterized protein n=1 Tax=Trichoderma citrinoviride TaxID=58853 RepID=A0A2T4BCT3_9HYPO|nr:hypothetical protein BBK36DRAFT_1199370 [Trichoderma citrinoviride]PTB67051.1 hypothetical protein BBK36DRAFT_1199370 [Trichoderma citrinoviride]